MNSRLAYNEAHPSYLNWQMDWPLFVKAPTLRTSNKVFKKGDYFPWAEMQIDPSKVASLYNQKLLHHDANKAKESGEGDRIGELSVRQMKTLVGLMNNELRKVHCATEQDFKRKRCRQSTITDTQRRFIRQFLAKNPFMTDYFVQERDILLKEPAKELEEA